MEYINIFGINLLPLCSFQQAYGYIKKEIKSGVHGYISINNAYTLVESQRDNYYRDALANSTLPFTDSQPLNMIFRKKGAISAVRIFGPSLLEQILQMGQMDNLRHFFYGSSEGTLIKLQKNINAKYPFAIISGMISPPFRPITADENRVYIEKINSCNPDIIWIGLGAPKQEIWMYENYRKINRGIMIGVGAGFDYLAGNTKHAPQWMKSMALEWLYRLIQEPRRLWKRYLVTNTLFLLYITLGLLHIRKFDRT